MKISFIGLGKLGLPVAVAIEAKGHEVLGYDISPKFNSKSKMITQIHTDHNTNSKYLKSDLIQNFRIKIQIRNPIPSENLKKRKSKI